MRMRMTRSVSAREEGVSVVLEVEVGEGVEQARKERVRLRTEVIITVR